MSYSNLKGFTVWGTSSYRIEIISDSTRLTSDFSGTLILWERRHLSSKKKFDNLESFIALLQETWQSVLPNARLQDARVARWLEEYLSELNIQTTYQQTFDAVRGIVEEVQTLEISEEKKLEQDLIEKLVEKKEDFIITGITKSIKGDLTDIKGIEKVLTKFLSEHKPVRVKNVLSTISFKDSNSQTRGMKENKGITDPILDENVSLWTGFNNTFSEAVKELQIVDVIPYSYKLISSSCKSEHSRSEQLTETGLEITWNFNEVNPGEKILIQYELDYRMVRTILIQDDNDLTLLHTYEDIKKDGSDRWIDARYDFKEKTDILEHVKILDQLPPNYQLLSTQPEPVEPLGKVTHYTSGVEIEWSHSNVPVNTQFMVTYDLTENQRMYRDKFIVQDKNENIVAEIIKVIKPLKNDTGYGVIMAIEAKAEISEILLVDRVSADFKIEAVHADSGNIIQEPGEIMKRMKWHLNDINPGNVQYAYFKYIGENKHELSNFSVIFPNKQSVILNQEIINKNEKVVFPFIYQNQIDV